MELYNGKPLLYINVTEDLEDENGMDRLSFVKNPAIKLEWMTYEAVNEYSSIENEDKRLITSPIMLANTPILREYKGILFYTSFTSDTIMRMMKKYFMQNKINNINEDHNKNKIVDDIYMVESFIVGDRVKSTLYPNIPDGSWVATYYVSDEQYWNDKIKNGNFNGVSLEGNLGLTEEELMYECIQSVVMDDTITDDEQYNKLLKIFSIND